MIWSYRGFMQVLAGAFVVLGASPAFAQTINSLTASPPGLSQAFAQVGGGDFTLTVNGSGFTPSSVVKFGTTSLLTTADSASPETKLTAAVPASLLKTTGVFGITVVNGSATSNSIDFKIVARGDVNADSEVRIGDALAIARSSVGLTKPPLPLSLVDLNFDNNPIVIGDALNLARFSVGLQPNFALPTINSATVSGSNVTINSTNNVIFSATASENVVFFSRSDGTFTAAAASSVAADRKQITVPIPAGAVSGPIFLKRKDHGLPSNPFILTLSGSNVPVYITDILPASSVAPGATITITGSGFSATKENNTVRFSSSVGSSASAGVTTFGTVATVSAAVTDATSTSLTVAVPAEAVTGFVTVTVGGQTSNKKSIVVSGTSTPLLLNHVYYSDVAGEPILIEGVGFNQIIPSDNKVFFKGATSDVQGVVTIAGRTRLVVLVPTGAASGDLRVETNANTRVSGTAKFADSRGEGMVDLVLTAPNVGNQIGAYQVTIQFDPKVVSVNPANVLGGLTTGFTSTPLVVNADNIAGTLTLAHFTTTAAPAGTFALARIQFSPLAAGTTQLTIEAGSAVVTDKDGNLYETGATLSLAPAQLTVVGNAIR